MSTPKNLAEDIACIQDGLAEIVTRDLIAGKVTSLRDAPRIVGIGRAIANLDKVASGVLDFEDVVEDPTAGNPEEDVEARGEEGPQTEEEFWEGLRRIEHAREAAEKRARQAEEIAADVAEHDPISDALIDAGPDSHEIEAQCTLCARPALTVDDHSNLCPWRRAVEWVQTQEFEGDVERLAAGEELGDPLQATLTRAADDAWSREDVDKTDPDNGEDQTTAEEKTDPS